MLATMPKKKATDPPEPPTQTVSFRVDADMLAILDRTSEENRHTRSVTVLILVEEALAARGLWPPKKPK